jgi:hypothetical protein
MSRTRAYRLLTRAAFALCALALLLQSSPACSTVRRGDTLYRVRADDLEERRAIHRQLWRVQRAVAEVRAAYELDDIALEVVVTNLAGLGQTTPALAGLAEIRGAKVVLAKHLLLGQHEELDEILLGLVAHELAHALHYTRLSKADLVELGLRYDQMLANPNGPARRPIRAYERLTDLTVIALGFGDALVYQKRASEANLAANDPPQVWDFYLTEPEIRALLSDRRLLRQEIEAAIAAVALPSFKRLKLDALVDADGDLLPAEETKDEG